MMESSHNNACKTQALEQLTVFEQGCSTKVHKSYRKDLLFSLAALGTEAAAMMPIGKHFSFFLISPSDMHIFGQQGATRQCVAQL